MDSQRADLGIMEVDGGGFRVGSRGGVKLMPMRLFKAVGADARGYRSCRLWNGRGENSGIGTGGD